MDYQNHSLQELVSICLERDILLPPESLDDRNKILSILNKQEQQPIVKIVHNYDKPPKKWTVQDFVRHFNQRYKRLSTILRGRKELANATSIARIKAKRERERVSFIGMVMSKNETKNKHIVMTIEDPTGQIEVWINANNTELINTSKEIVYDEVIGFTGQATNGRVFADSVLFPDVPIHKELKKGPRDENVIFVGDVEVGSKLFLEEEFEQFIAWLNGEIGNEEQRGIAKKTKYVVFLGDLVHGAGVYPNQHEDQHPEFHDIREQYKQFAKQISRIPSHIQIVLTTGNHDAGRLQEPQLPLYEDLAEELYNMPNVTILSNPATINIGSTPTFQGFDILLYHGYSLIYYSDNIQPIREAGGQKASEKIMQVYLKKRHLAPSHGSNTYVPDPEEDPLLIETIPDFLVTGHIHRIAHGTYNGVTMINCGCWNDVSDEQIKRGLEPQPAKLPVVNLKTRKIRVVNFYQGRKKDE